MIIFDAPCTSLPSMKFRDSARFLREFTALVVDGGKIRGLGCIRTYVSGRGGTNYAAVWIYGEEENHSGSGKASGYGYNREGAAVDSALEAAGIYGAYAESTGIYEAARAVFTAVAVRQGFDSASLYINEANA